MADAVALLNLVGNYRYVKTRHPRDRLDWLAQEIYGYTAGAVEALLDANRGLASHNVWLPPDLEILVPELPPQKPQRVRLWT